MNRPRSKPRKMNWYTRQKMKWIAECLAVFGFVNRAHLARKFGISTQQASNDLQLFIKANPDQMQYDVRKKTYVAKKLPRAVNK